MIGSQLFTLYCIERPHRVHTQRYPLLYWRYACAECCSPLVCGGVPVSRVHSVPQSLHRHSWPIPRGQGQGRQLGTHSRVSKGELELVIVYINFEILMMKAIGTGVWRNLLHDQSSLSHVKGNVEDVNKMRTTHICAHIPTLWCFVGSCF